MSYLFLQATLCDEYTSLQSQIRGKVGIRKMMDCLRKGNCLQYRGCCGVDAHVSCGRLVR
jgi:hypothetical protein